MKLSLETNALAWALLAAALSLGGAWLAAQPIKLLGSAAPSSASSSEPIAVVTSPELVAQGHELFEMSCSECHGDDAHGDEGPDLHNLSISNARIAATIKKGVKGQMPTFAKKFDDQQVAILVGYLRSLR